MKKLLLTAAVLLLLSLNTVSMHANEVIIGKAIASADYMSHKLVTGNKTYDLKLSKPYELRDQQTIEVEGDFIDDKTIRVDKLIVISDARKTR